jgi:hypothetical protein
MRAEEDAMHVARVGSIGLMVVLGFFAGQYSTLTATQAPLEIGCPATSAAQLRTTLYFGMDRPKGSVSELEFQMFLRDEVTTRFPDGLTVWDADGQWRDPNGLVDHENAKVLLLVHADTAAARGAVYAVIERYRKMFEQESVLWETARVCVAS